MPKTSAGRAVRICRSALVLIVMSAASVTTCARAATPVDFQSGDNERILEVALSEGTILQSALIAYQVGDDWYLPIGDFAQSLGIYIKTMTDLASAQGFILEERRSFALTPANCQLRIQGARREYACEQVVPFESDIYVDSRLLAEWLPVDIALEPLKSRISITPREKLPAQLKRERESRGEGGGSEVADPGFPRREIDSDLFAGPIVDQQLRLSRSRAGGRTEHVGAFDTTAGWEMLGLDGNLHWSGNTDALNAPRLNLARKDPEGRLLGVVHATELQAADIDMPVLPLVASGAQKRGVLVSNRPLGQSSTLTTQDFIGTLLPEWEVELYQNEILVGRQSPGPDGRYAFREVPLLFGLNQFKLVFYGPFGQTRTEFQTYQIGSNLLRRGESSYRAALALDQGQPLYTAFYDRGLSSRWTASLGSSRLAGLPGAGSGTYYGWGSVSGFAESILLSMTTAHSSTSGHAYELLARAPFKTFSIGAQVERLDRFRSELFNSRAGSGALQTSQMRGDANFRLPIGTGLGLNVDLTRREYEETTPSSTALHARATTTVSSFILSHDASYDLGRELDPYEAQLDVSRMFSESRVRLGTLYRLKQVQALEGEVQIQLGRDYSWTTVARQAFEPSLLSVTTRVSRQFESFTLQGDLGCSTDQNYSVGVGLTTSLTRDPYQSRIRLAPTTQANSGASSVNVFVDANRNGIRDAGEKGYPEAEVRGTQSSDGRKTDADGFAYFAPLAPYQPLDLFVSGATIQDPLLRPGTPGTRFYPRPGRVTGLTMPLVYVGMIDGIVLRGKGRGARPARGVRINLLEQLTTKAIRTVKTDSEGFYWFDDIPPGTYWLSPEDFAVEARRGVYVPPTGVALSGQDFVVRP